jgi:hypothetical protein
MAETHATKIDGEYLLATVQARNGFVCNFAIGDSDEAKATPLSGVRILWETLVQSVSASAFQCRLRKGCQSTHDFCDLAIFLEDAAEELLIDGVRDVPFEDCVRDLMCLVFGWNSGTDVPYGYPSHPCN